MMLLQLTQYLKNKLGQTPQLKSDQVAKTPSSVIKQCYTLPILKEYLCITVDQRLVVMRSMHSWADARLSPNLKMHLSFSSFSHLSNFLQIAQVSLYRRIDLKTIKFLLKRQ